MDKTETLAQEVLIANDRPDVRVDRNICCVSTCEARVG